MSGRGYLLDTHIFLWDLADDKRISPVHDEILLGDEPKYLSVASLWKIAIKASVGKLTIPAGLLETIEASDVKLLPILHSLQPTPSSPAMTWRLPDPAPAFQPRAS